MGCGFLIYGLVSLALWHVVGYHFWIRLIVTMLMAIFALLQIFWPGMLSDPEKAHRARIILLIIVGGMAACWFSSRYGIVLADDVGWSEWAKTRKQYRAARNNVTGFMMKNPAVQTTRKGTHICRPLPYPRRRHASTSPGMPRRLARNPSFLFFI